MSGIGKICIILGIIFCLRQTKGTTDYCSESLCNGAQHIACNNKGKYAKACMSNAKIIKLSSAEREAIVNKHNKLRHQVALGKLKGFQPAIRMATMTWDKELAKLAEMNVKQCEMKHDACRNTIAFRNAGQNLAFTGWSGSTNSVEDIALQQIKSWFDEYKSASMKDIKKLNDSKNL